MLLIDTYPAHMAEIGNFTDLDYTPLTESQLLDANIAAIIRRNDALESNGYNTVPVECGGKKPVGTNWQNRTSSTQKERSEWADRGYSTGILTKHTPVADIDIRDPEIAATMLAFTLKELGVEEQDAVIRIGLAPKSAVICQVEAPFKKLKSKKYKSPDGKEHQIEILGDGQQLVVGGVHAITQQPYHYPKRNIVDVPVSELPLLSPHIAQKIINKFESIILDNWGIVGKSNKREVTSKDSGIERVNYRNNVLPPDTAEILNLLSRTPPADDHDEWCDRGMILHNEYQGSDEGCDIWIEDSKRSSNYNSESECIYKWSTFNTKPLSKKKQLSVGTLKFLVEEYENKQAKKVIKSLPCGELKEMTDDMVKIAERKLPGSSATINWKSVRDSYDKSFLDATKSKIVTINPKGDLPVFSAKEFHGGIRQELFGNLCNFNSLVKLAEENNPDDKPANHAALAKKIVDAIDSKFKKHLSIYRQRSIIAYSTDMFETEPKLVITDECVRLISIHKPFPEGDIDIGIVDDYKEHFPELDNFILLLVASRFASDRKKAFFWLKAVSDWGKGFLSSAFKDLGILTEMSVSEIKAALVGTPIGKQAKDFKHCWVLLVDEFKTINSEVKQLTSSIKGSPKNQMTFEAELFMKLFTSAEEVDSLGGSGVETQFSNRFSLIPTNDYSLEHRALFTSIGKTRYLESVKNYIASELNKLVSQYVAMGKIAAADTGDKMLEDYNTKHKLSVHYGSLDDTVDDIVNAIRDMIIAATPGAVNGDNNWGGIRNYINKHTTAVYYKKQLCMLVQNVDKVISDYIDENVSPSEKAKIGFKKTQIRSFLDDSERTNKNNPVRVLPVGSAEDVLKKGVLVKL